MTRISQYVRILTIHFSPFYRKQIIQKSVTYTIYDLIRGDGNGE